MRGGRGALFPGAASVAVRVTGTALAFLLGALLARTMGPSGYGVYSFAMAVATLMIVPTQFGLPTLIVREVSRYRVMDRWDLARGLLLRALQFLVLTSVLAIVVVSALGRFLPTVVTSAQTSTLSWAAFLIPIIAFNNCGDATLRAHGRVIYGQIAEQVVRPGMLLVLVAGGVVLAGPAWVSPASAMRLHVLSASAAFLVGAVLLLRTLPASLWGARASAEDLPQWRRSLLPLSMLAGLQVITSQTDILMLGFFVADDDLGRYRVAWQLASLVNLILFAMGRTVEPAIARLREAGEHGRLQKMVTRSGRTAFALSLAASLGLITIGRPLLALVFGPAFLDSYVPLVILCVGQVGLAFSGWAVIALNMTGHERTTMHFTAYAAVGNVIANAILIPAFGLVGAAIATASTMFVWKLALAFAARRVAGIGTLIASRRSSSRSGNGP